MLSDIDVLGLLVQADESVDDRQPWQLYPTGSGTVWVGCTGWPDGLELPSGNQLDDMDRLGWIQITGYVGDRGRKFAVTTDGREEWARQLARQAHVPGRVDVGWDAGKPVLREIYERYQEAGAPEAGVDVSFLLVNEDAARQNAAIIRELFRDDQLEEPEFATDQSTTARPTPKAMQILGGWPSGAAEDALNELVRAVDSEIEATTDQAKRSKLIAVRDGIASAGRDVVLAYFEKKVMGL